MDQQIHPYNPTLSAHFINLALAAEAQCAWETSEPQHEQLENPFAVPLEYYEKLFATSNLSGESVKAEVDGPIQEMYDFIGSIRLGQQPVADYADIDEEVSLSNVQDFDAMLKLMTHYSRRWTEGVANTVRYSGANLLMGFALRSNADGHGVIVLRGTMTADEWLNNINYRLRPFLPAEPDCGDVHLGFRDIYKGLRGRYRELAAEFEPAQNLYLVGHSLGAAVSKLGAFDLVSREPTRRSTLQAYLFAPPRIGDKIFTQQYDERVGTSYRIVNVCDIVPYIPFEEIGEVVDLLGYPYADTKGEIAYVHQAGNPIANHVASYHIATQQQVPGVMDVSSPRRVPLV
ncbi:MAG: lipase family protein [Chloroflexota bacterium]